MSSLYKYDRTPVFNAINQVLQTFSSSAGVLNSNFNELLCLACSHIRAQETMPCPKKI